MITRNLKINESSSLILLGPRQCGKSTWVKAFLKVRPALTIDLLSTSLFRKYKLNPESFYAEALYQIQENKIRYFFIDEIQKIPELLNEVHRLIEEKRDCLFILSGSSASSHLFIVF